jgi:hypothetical protein
MGETPQKTDHVTPGSAATRHVLFEPMALVLLSLATVDTAWCSFQANPFARNNWGRTLCKP